MQNSIEIEDTKYNPQLELLIEMLDLDNWCPLPTSFGNFRMYDTGNEEIRIVSLGDINELRQPVLIRIHSSCLASEVFGALDCDCADQLSESIKLISTEGEGIIFHLHQEGRGQGLSNKIRAVRMMEIESIDTAESFEKLGLKQDVRNYDPIALMIKQLSISSVRLISNNPRKKSYLEAKGIEVSTVNTHPTLRTENEAYLHSKNEKLGHNIPISQEMELTEVIEFYHSDQPWGEFSNFSRHAVFIDNVIWNTVEHFYQASKFEKTEHIEFVRRSPSPMAAKERALNLKSFKRANWEEEKEKVMYRGITAKFLQHPELEKKLISTGSAHLIELTSKDPYWGQSKDGKGSNRLGELLMSLRNELSK